MRKLLLLIVSLFVVTSFAWARNADFYSQVVASCAEQFQVEKNSIGNQPVMLAGNNMITDGQRAGLETLGLQPAATSRDFYNDVLAAKVDELQAENAANWAGPTLLAGNNMITGRAWSGRRREDFYNRVLSAQLGDLRAVNEANWASPTLLAGNNMITGGQVWSGRGRQDFYNRELSARVGEFQSENNSIGAEPMLLAGNNMVTGERVVFTPEAAAPEDFYNQVLSAQVSEYSIDNNAVAPSNIEFAESQPLTIVPGSMAANVGSEGDWYSRTVAKQAELNRRIKKSQSPNGF